MNKRLQLVKIANLFPNREPSRHLMDKKTKKQIEVLRQKQEKTQKLLSDAKAQTDDPGEVAALEKQLDDIRAKIAELKSK